MDDQTDMTVELTATVKSKGGVIGHRMVQYQCVGDFDDSSLGQALQNIANAIAEDTDRTGAPEAIASAIMYCNGVDCDEWKTLLVAATTYIKRVMDGPSKTHGEGDGNGVS